MNRRNSGIILPISALGSEYGIGTMGKEAYAFADFLKKSGQKYWQILPIGATSYGDSPYQSFSAFAGNPYFIDFDILTEQGILVKEDYQDLNWGDDKNYVDYKAVFENRFIVLKMAFERGYHEEISFIEKFKEENKAWLLDYALFMALKYYNDQLPFHKWEREIKLHEEIALEKYREKLKTEVDFWIYIQYLFFKQWKTLKKYVNSLGIEIIGDIPIYTAYDSADVWANPEYFLLDAERNPIEVAGCPPDGFTATGQLWGNPLYRWNIMKEQGYKWWVERMKSSMELYDVVKIDHFRGFESYYSVPAEHDTAEHGVWKKGCGIELFDMLKAKLGDIKIIAEDLGYLTDDVKKLLKQSGYPGMKVMQFAFDSREESDYLPHNYDKYSVAYTGTHDNDTVRGWLNTAPKSDLDFCKKYLRLTEAEGENWGFIRGAWSSVSQIAIAQIQDFLDLDSSARTNVPSTIGLNWRWRIDKSMLTDELANKIYDITKTYGRVN